MQHCMKRGFFVKPMKLLATGCIAAVSLGIHAPPAHAGADSYVGEIMVGGWNFCPNGSLRADGTLLSIDENSALFALYGTTFGGDGSTTFALPNLQGRIPIHNGQGTGLTQRDLGETGGSETNTMTIAQMPAHNHTGSVIRASNLPGNSANPNGRVLAADSSADRLYQDTAPAVSMSSAALTITAEGGGQPIDNMQPYLALTYCVATEGVFPSRP
jgi:microcystin-dependent protein